MRRRFVIGLGLVVLLAITFVPALAITNGEPDAGRHPYVGLLLLYDEDWVPLWRCSGTLISEDLFLTAGHCTFGAAHAQVWFAESSPFDLAYTGGSCKTGGPYTSYPCVGGVEGVPHTNPDYCDSPCGNGLPGFAYRDVGLVTLDTPVAGPYGALPSAGLVDTLRNKTPIDFVGYGVREQLQIPGSQLPQPPPRFRWTGRSRYYAPSELVSGKFTHSDEFIRFALNPGGGSGGLCFGDSGGPDLLRGSNVILSVNSYVTNVNCSGVGYSSRVDIQEVLDWITGPHPSP